MKEISLTLFFWAFYAFMPSVMAQKIVYVNHQVTSTNNDGTSWTKAYKNLSTALAATSAPAEIWIANGSYFATETNDRNISFKILNGIQLYGGFDGTENQKEQRKPKINKTIISGDIGIKGDSLDNTYCLFEMTDVDSTTIIDGLCITGATADSVAIELIDTDKAKGGAAFRILAEAKHCNPQLLNCEITRNRAIGYGGAILTKGYDTFIAQPIIRNCRFSENRAIFGGAYWSNSNMFERILCENCDFVGNSASLGGCFNLFNFRQGSVILKKCNFNSNTSNGAALYAESYYAAVNLLIDSCTFSHNYGNLISFSSKGRSQILNSSFLSTQKKQGTELKTLISLGSLNSSDNDITIIKNCVFKQNDGSRVLNLTDIGDLVLENCLFQNNIVNNGEIYHRGLSLKLNNCMFEDFGTLAFGNAKSAIISNSTFIKKRKNTYLSVFGKNNVLKNNIFVNLDTTKMFYLDSNMVIGHCLFNKSDFRKDFLLEENEILKINFSNIKTGNPLFRDTLNHDFRLQSCSPAINAGTLDLPAEVKALLENDLDGKPRIVSDSIDIGAYEYRDLKATAAVTQGKCAGDLGSFNVNATGACLPLKISWLRADGKKDTTSQNLEAGSYQVRVLDANKSYVDMKFSINALLEIGSSSSILNPSALNNDGSIELYNTNGGTAPYTYLWNTGATTAKITKLTAAYYTVTITDKNGCQAIKTYKVGNPIATKDLVLESAVIYPNPVNDKLFISLINNEIDNIKIIIYDMQGRVVSSQDYEKKGVTVGFLPKGVYVLKLRKGSGAERVMRFVKHDW